MIFAIFISIGRNDGHSPYHKIQWVNVHSGSVGNAQVPPLAGGGFPMSAVTLDHVQSSGGRPQN